MLTKHIDNQILDDCLNLIEQITSDKQGWLNFYKKILKVLNASYVHVQAIDFNYQVVSYSNGIGPLNIENYISTELDYLRYPTEADPRWGKFLDQDRHGWYQCHTHVSEEFVKQSDLYQKILLPVDLRYVATHELIRDDKICVFWSVTTSEQRKPLNQYELAFLNQLLPYLKRVVIAQRHLYEFSLDNIVGYNLINQIQKPIMLLNLSGQIVHQNELMQGFLKQNLLIQIENYKIKLPKQYQQKFLELLYQIEKAFRSSIEPQQLDSFRDIDFCMDHPEIKLVLNLLASEKEMSFFGIRPLVMVQIEGLYIQKIVNCSIRKKMIDQYGLTKREIEICEQFVSGIKLEKIAENCGVTLGSLRTYLKRIFAKTQITSQAALMRFLIKNRFDHKD
ncbi:helix-turn-helix transcriptional regulator [Acinetobacter johnsonii]|uniref:helix-turn-helix transcriptional regulator n=1 Tax=Acinetobacter TaxID=469 RepID=UPI003F55C719